MSNIFITGATGFLGSNLAGSLLRKEKNRVYALVRTGADKSLSRRKKELIGMAVAQGVPYRKASRIHVIDGDISKDGLGLSKKEMGKLKNVIDTVYHSAALCELSSPLSILRKTNVNGTENVLKIALDWQKNGHVKSVNHISTAYIAGDLSGTFYERQLDVSQGFNNSYEKSKFEAELVVEKYRKMGLAVDIYRPSIIIDTIPPSANSIPWLLRLLAIFMLGIFKKIPASDETKLNFIPVDTVVKSMFLIQAAKNRPANQNYHIADPKPVKLGTVLNTASDVFGFRRPECVHRSAFSMNEIGTVQKKVLESFVPYLNQDLSFDMQNTDLILRKYNFKIPSLSKKDVIVVFKHYKNSNLIPARKNRAIKR